MLSRSIGWSGNWNVGVESCEECGLWIGERGEELGDGDLAV